PAQFADDAAAAREVLIEAVSENDDEAMEAYLEGRALSEDQLVAAIRRATIANKIAPVLCGSALKDKGVQPLLDAVVAFLPSPVDVPPVVAHDVNDPEVLIERHPDDNEPLAAIAFK